MSRLRFAQHARGDQKNWRGGFDLPAQGYVEPASLSNVSGWVVGPWSAATTARLRVFGGPLSQHMALPEWREVAPTQSGGAGPVPGRRFRFSFDLALAQRLVNSDDFAVELLLTDGDKTVGPLVLTMVVDQCATRKVVLIVGSPRSGTSILGESIRHVTDSPDWYGEHHLLPLVEHMRVGVDEYCKATDATDIPGMMLSHLCPELLSAQFHTIIKKQYVNAYRDAWLIDKTPGGQMVRALPSIVKLWPEARVIFARRRGIDNVASRLRKFPQEDFRTHCIQWRNCMQAWQVTRPRLEHALDVDQYDIQARPEAVAADLVTFLGLAPEKAAVLEKRFRRNRPERTSDPKAPVLPLQAVGWSPEQMDLFMEICGPMMQVAGYGMDAQYYHLGEAA